MTTFTDSGVDQVALTPGGDVLVYEAPDGGVRVEVKLARDTV